MPVIQHHFCIEYISKTDIKAWLDKHPGAVNDNRSLWDHKEPEDFTQTIFRISEDDAFRTAQKVLPLDEFGEVHVDRQSRLGGRGEWNTEATAVVRQEDTQFTWVAV